MPTYPKLAQTFHFLLLIGEFLVKTNVGVIIFRIRKYLNFLGWLHNSTPSSQGTSVDLKELDRCKQQGECTLT